MEPQSHTHDREVRVNVAPVEVEQVLLGLTIWEKIGRAHV